MIRRWLTGTIFISSSNHNGSPISISCPHAKSWRIFSRPTKMASSLATNWQLGEDKFFHWITSRALSDLIDRGLVRTEKRKLAIGSELKLLWHRSNRYYKRGAKRLVELVNEYGSPNMCGAIGLHGEQMILGGFARRQ